MPVTIVVVIEPKRIVKRICIELLDPEISRKRVLSKINSAVYLIVTGASIENELFRKRLLNGCVKSPGPPI